MSMNATSTRATTTEIDHLATVIDPARDHDVPAPPAPRFCDAGLYVLELLGGRRSH